DRQRRELGVLRWRRGRRGWVGEGHLIDESAVVAAVGVEADKANGVDAGGECEDGGGKVRVGGARRRERAHRGTVDLHLERLGAALVSRTLGGAEGNDIRA